MTARLVLIIGLFASVISVHPGFAQDDGGQGGASAGSSDLKLPNVGGHVFVPIGIVPDPFIRTYFRMTLGLGQAFDVQSVAVEIDGEPVVGLKGDILFLGADVEYSQALKDWVAFRASIVASGRLGTNVGTLLSSGISTASGFRFGWLFRLLESQKVALSGDVSFSNRSFTIINVNSFVEDIVAGRPPQLTKKVPSTRVTGGVRVAWGVSELFGVNGILDTGYGESINPNEGDKIFYTLGANFDFDLRAFSSIPLGVATAFKIDSFPEGGEDVENALRSTSLKIAYNGREDFSIGLAISGEYFKRDSTDENINFGSVGFDLRYFF